MSTTRTCPECGAPLPADLAGGGCPTCALRGALELSGADAEADAAVVAEKAGDQIDRFKLLQKIGEGGMGTVWMAEQTEPLRRHVALKIIKLGMDTKQVVARFEAERQALALMDHPNIAKVLDAGATDTGRPYFVMELVRGEKITDYCDQHRLPTKARLDLFVQVCHAIQHAHQKGVIHRDIKPSNILVTLQDGVPVPKVIDFGIAKATGQQRLTDKTLFTAFRQFLGTPAYMSPEQAQMSGVDIDTRSDIYSLGVLVYELLTSRLPFEGRALLQAGLDEIRRMISEQEPPKPSAKLSTLAAADLTMAAQRRNVEPPKLVHLLRGDLDWIVMKTLEKDRTRRYETAGGLALDIRHYLNGDLVVARPPSCAYRFYKMVRRNELGFAVAAAIAGSIVAGSVFMLQFLKAGNGKAPPNAEAAKTAATNWVRLLSTTPASPATLKGWQTLHVILQYSVGNETNLTAFVSPRCTQMAGIPAQSDPETQLLPNNEIMASFGCSGVDVYDLEVSLYGGANGRRLALECFPVNFHWETAPPESTKEMMVVNASVSNFVSIISINPASPAVLHLNDRMTLKLRYSCQTRGVRLWVQAYGMNGASPSGFFTNGSLYFEPIAGHGETDYCQFGCQYQADVEKVEVTMVDSDSNTRLAVTSMPIEAHWK
jgi:serine/threonine protein kinase